MILKNDKIIISMNSREGRPGLFFEEEEKIEKINTNAKFLFVKSTKEKAGF